MSGRDSLPHFPAPGKAYHQQQSPPPQLQQQRPPPHPRQQSQAKMYSPPYGQTASGGGTPGTYPSAGYQVGPPGSPYGVAQSTYTVQQTYVATATSPAPAPQGVDADLYRLFQAADSNGSGQLSEKELGRALVNGDYTAFDAKTVKLMVNMFDVDRSGAIDRKEFANALGQFGYRLSDAFVGILFTSYDKNRNGQMGFDMFVQSMVTVKTLTDVFKGLDTDRDGFITIGFEQFLDIILRQRA